MRNIFSDNHGDQAILPIRSLTRLRICLRERLWSPFHSYILHFRYFQNQQYLRPSRLLRLQQITLAVVSLPEQFYIRFGYGDP